MLKTNYSTIITHEHIYTKMLIFFNNYNIIKFVRKNKNK